MLRSGRERSRSFPCRSGITSSSSPAAHRASALQRCGFLAGEGASAVVIADTNRASGEALASELGPAARFALTDVTSEQDAQAAVDLALSAFGHLHGLVNCAGVAPSEKILGREGPHRLDSFARTVNINLVGTFNMIRLAAAAIAKEAPGEDGERGLIVNTASIAAFDGQIDQAAYSASKGGVVSLTLPIARELARFGIRVVTIAPGIFDTPMMAAFSPEIQESLAKSVPFPARLGHPPSSPPLLNTFARTLCLTEKPSVSMARSAWRHADAFGY